jgi:hypothetical protein
MWRMRQRILPVADSRRPQNSSHGGIAAQVSRLQSLLQPALQLKNPSVNTHRPQTLRMQLVRKGLQTQLRLAKTRSHPCRGRRPGRWTRRRILALQRYRRNVSETQKPLIGYSRRSPRKDAVPRAMLFVESLHHETPPGAPRLQTRNRRRRRPRRRPRDRSGSGRSTGNRVRESGTCTGTTPSTPPPAPNTARFTPREIVDHHQWSFSRTEVLG